VTATFVRSIVITIPPVFSKANKPSPRADADMRDDETKNKYLMSPVPHLRISRSISTGFLETTYPS
jgi:hypothetical protein